MAPQVAASTAVTEVNSSQSAWKAPPETYRRVIVEVPLSNCNSPLPAARTGWPPQVSQEPRPMKLRSTVCELLDPTSTTTCMWNGVP